MAEGISVEFFSRMCRICLSVHSTTNSLYSLSEEPGRGAFIRSTHLYVRYCVYIVGLPTFAYIFLISIIPCLRRYTNRTIYLSIYVERVFKSAMLG